MARAWDTVDERVLRWVFERPPTLTDAEILDFALTDPQPFAPLAGIDTRQASEALYRLASADLVTAEYRNLAHTASWWQLRVAPLGLKVLGEWPDLERIASAVGIRALLLQLADGAETSEQTTLRRAAGLVGRTSSEVVRETIATLASEVTKDVLE